MQNYRLKYIFYSNWKQFQVFKIAKFEFNVTVHLAYRQNAPSCDPLKHLFDITHLLVKCEVNEWNLMDEMANLQFYQNWKNRAKWIEVSVKFHLLA